MNDSRAVLWVVCMLALLVKVAPAQDRDGFDVEAYRQFLSAHQNMTEQQLLALHPAGLFKAHAATEVTATPYFSRIDSLYHFTPYEKELLATHGFVVSERLKQQSIGLAYHDAWHADLPVFVTTDAILHAFHMSYDNILQTVERQILIGSLDSLLSRLHEGVPALAARYGGQMGMRTPLLDMDFYLAVARQLLGRGGAPVFAQNTLRISDMLQRIAGESPAEVALFGGGTRVIDFSQFKPRGHYADDPVLQKYFKAMIWLGRTEIYCSAPVGDPAAPTDSSIQMQALMAVLLVESAHATGAQQHFDRIERILQFFVGDQDNISLGQLSSFIVDQGIASAAELLPAASWKSFQEKLLQQSFATQRIISQILWSDPFDTAQITPASAFLLVGQRFIVDSYVTGNVVFDRILFEGKKMTRMLPSTFDVLYALGNDAAAQLLQPALAQYHYGTNLAALRYLVDGYDSSFWGGTLYNGWLDALRSLNPPVRRDQLPPFMQTGAWWQEKMNTQLAGWAQLRHDNLLYAKQSYTGVPICSFPESYVEPIPAFFEAMKAIAHQGSSRFGTSDLGSLGSVRSYFLRMEAIMDTLGGIAGKELSFTPLGEEERRFLQSMLYETQYGCASTITGWYARLYYAGETALQAADYVVADVHTSPADESGAIVGWVLHAGTGPVNLGTFLVTLPSGQHIACVGPVLSYYEFVSVNFNRLTDEEWKTQYGSAPAFRPDFVNLYLADEKGGSRGSGRALITTGVALPPTGEVFPVTCELLQNHPNPFNSTTVIPLTVNAPSGVQRVELLVHDLQGRLVRSLLRADLPGGHYTVRWEGTNDKGVAVASGTYLYTLYAGSRSVTKKLVLLR
jgi:hypothetical protein